jgi:UDP-3-O-[3-hydroxymyristoyl] glucosamine N-acyltransferase
VVISAATKLSKSITRPGIYTAILPVQSHADWIKNFSHLRHLDSLVERVRALEKLMESPEKP